jgi:hypothetical protein
MTQYAKNITATATVVGDSARLFGFSLTSEKAATAQIKFSDLTDAKAVGTAIITLLVPPGSDLTQNFNNGGIRFENGIHVSVPISIDGMATYG